jgi:crotonobetaine/carnitine-CoA ligase
VSVEIDLGSQVAIVSGGGSGIGDRKQDFLRRWGENISSFEVEASVGRHPAIEAVAAHAVPSEATEDELKVCIVLKEGEKVSHEELAEFCNENLPYFAVPRYTEFIDELPLTPTGRVQKYMLRERGVTPETWDREAAGFTGDHMTHKTHIGEGDA